MYLTLDLNPNLNRHKRLEPSAFILAHQVGVKLRAAQGGFECGGLEARELKANAANSQWVPIPGTGCFCVPTAFEWLSRTSSALRAAPPCWAYKISSA